MVVFLIMCGLFIFFLFLWGGIVESILFVVGVMFIMLGKGFRGILILLLKVMCVLLDFILYVCR